MSDKVRITVKEKWRPGLPITELSYEWRRVGLRMNSIVFNKWIWDKRVFKRKRGSGGLWSRSKPK